MLTKVLFTLAVIVAVALIFRQKTESRTTKNPARDTRSNDSGVQSKTVVYAILGLIVAVSGLLFVLHWQAQHQIVNIEITDGGGETISYQAYKKSIEGRRFVTLDGREVTLGDNDRVEMTAAD